MSRLQTFDQVRFRPLGEIATFLDHLRKPVRVEDRRAGPYPYYGANGLQGTIDGFLFDERLVLLAEDGGHFEEAERGIAYRVSGKVWVNNHAHVLRPGPCVDWAYLARVLENMDVRKYISGTTRSKLTKGQAENIGNCPVDVADLEGGVLNCERLASLSKAALPNVRELDLGSRVRLARSLFEKEERLLPEGETWDGLDNGGQGHYMALVEAVLVELDVILRAE